MTRPRLRFTAAILALFTSVSILAQNSTAAGWRKDPANPIISPSLNAWDHDACYKPYAILDGSRWLLWYNGRHGSVEQIGLATHEGKDLGFR